MGGWAGLGVSGSLSWLERCRWWCGLRGRQSWCGCRGLLSGSGARWCVCWCVCAGRNAHLVCACRCGWGALCVLLCAHTHRALCASCFCLVLCCSSTCVCVYMSGRCSAGGVSCRPCCSSSLPGGAAGVCGLRLFSLAGASAWSCWDVAEWAALGRKWHAPLTTPALSRAHTAPTHAPHTRARHAQPSTFLLSRCLVCE